ncbi:MAG: SemiSWEET transporter [Synechococcaceae cyanobacterium]|nr:SemiSWEET transporter [Synechococcaceae cyanobacterium]
MAHPLPVTLLGYGAASLTTLSFFPQAIKTLRSRDTRAISLPMYLLLTSGLACWGIYGLLTGDGPLIIANAITLMPALVVLERKLREPRASAGLKLWRGS